MATLLQKLCASERNNLRQLWNSSININIKVYIRRREKKRQQNNNKKIEKLFFTWHKKPVVSHTPYRAVVAQFFVIIIIFVVGGVNALHIPLSSIENVQCFHCQRKATHKFKHQNCNLTPRHHFKLMFSDIMSVPLRESLFSASLYMYVFPYTQHSRSHWARMSKFLCQLKSSMAEFLIAHFCIFFACYFGFPNTYFEYFWNRLLTVLVEWMFVHKIY